MAGLDRIVKDRIKKILKDEGIEDSENVFIEQFKLSDIPQDAYLTESALIRAEYEAKDIDEKYLCYMCGKKYNDPNDFINCMKRHIQEFMAGVPIKMTKEMHEKRMQSLRKPVDPIEVIKKMREEKK